MLAGHAAEDLRRQLVERADRGHKTLEAGGDARHQRTGAVGPGLVGVRDAARGEEEVPGAQVTVNNRYAAHLLALQEEWLAEAEGVLRAAEA